MSLLTEKRGENTPKNHGAQRYCIRFKMPENPERKYISHSSEKCFFKCSDEQYIKNGLIGSLGIRDDDVKHYKKSKHKWKKELKALKKHNKMLYIIAKKSDSCLKLKNIKKIIPKAFKKRGNSSSNSSRDE